MPFILAATTNKEFGDTGNRFIATDTGVGSILTSFTAPMDIEILAMYLHTAQTTTETVVAIGEFNAIVDSATSTTYDYTYVNYDLEDLTTGTTMVWPGSTDGRHYYLAKEDHLDLTSPLLTTATAWALEIHYDRR